MLKLPQKTLDSIKKYLLKTQKQVESNLKEVQKDDPITQGALAETSEPGTESWLAEGHNRATVLISQLKNMGVDISHALGKIRLRVYGKCEKCGQYIEISRLIAMPTAKYCLSCSKKSPKS